ncbi:MAG: polysaccharide biosynthesis C-terminal domain-containing protein [Bacteroidota bacterium]
MPDTRRPDSLFIGKWVVLFRLAYLQGIGMALVFGSNLLLTNLLSTDEYGAYVSILQGIMLFSVLLIGGLDEWITVELPALIKSNDLPTARILHHWSNSYLLKRFFTSLTVVSIIYFLWIWFSDSTPATIIDFALGAGIALLITLFVKQVSELRSTGHYQLVQVMDNIAKPLAQPLFLLLSVCIVQLPATSSVSIGAQLMGLLILVIGTRVILQNKQPYLQEHLKINTSHTVDQLPGRYRLSVFNRSSLLHYLLVRADLLILTLLGSNVVVGQYNVLNRVTEWCMAPAILLNTAHIKEVSEAKLTEPENGLPTLIKQLIWKSAAFTALTAAVLFLAGVGILNLFGTSYVQGYSLLFPMTLSFLFMATAAPMNHWLKVLGKESVSLRITTVTVIAQIFLCTGLFYRMGPLGAAWGTMFANLLYLILQILSLRSRKES